MASFHCIAMKGQIFYRVYLHHAKKTFVKNVDISGKYRRRKRRVRFYVQNKWRLWKKKKKNIIKLLSDSCV